MDPSQPWQQSAPNGQPQYPNQPPPAQPYANQPYSAQPYANQPYSAQPYSAQPYSAQPYPTQPQPAQPYPAQPHPAQPYPAQPYATPYAQPQPAPPAPPQRNRFLLYLVISAVLLVVMAVSVVVVALHRGSSDKGAKGPAGAPTSAAGPVDACLVGKWKQTSYQKVVDMAGTDIDKRETIGKVKMNGGGKQWTINADGTAVEDDSATVYSGKDATGRTINATFSGKADWDLKTVDRKIQFSGKESTESVVISVDGRKAGTINLEPNLDPIAYTCTGDIWRTTDADDPDSFARYDRVK